MKSVVEDAAKVANNSLQTLAISPSTCQIRAQMAELGMRWSPGMAALMQVLEKAGFALTHEKKFKLRRLIQQTLRFPLKGDGLPFAGAAGNLGLRSENDWQ